MKVMIFIIRLFNSAFRVDLINDFNLIPGIEGQILRQSFPKKRVVGFDVAIRILFLIFYIRICYAKPKDSKK